MAEKIKIVILGPGAIGGLLAVLLSKSGYDVCCVAKKERVAILTAKGLSLQSAFFGNFVAYPRFVETLDFEPNVLFITVKAPRLKEAIQDISESHLGNTLIVPLLNGLEHMDFLREQFGTRVVAGTIGAVEALLKEPAVIEHLSQSAPSITLTRHEGMAPVVDALRAAGISVSILENEHDVIWGKLLRLSVLAAFTAVSRENLGTVRTSEKWRPLIEKFLMEGEAVAHADGATVRATKALSEIDALPAVLQSSLKKDLEQEKESELDAIVGGIVRRGGTYGIACPTIELILKEIYTVYHVSA